ncbi:MAG: hypothetical protein WAL45_12025, partial [Terracidiphilus sp.]
GCGWRCRLALSTALLEAPGLPHKWQCRHSVELQSCIFKLTAIVAVTDDEGPNDRNSSRRNSEILRRGI